MQSSTASSRNSSTKLSQNSRTSVSPQVVLRFAGERAHRAAGYPPETLHQILSSKAADPSGKGKARETDPSWVEVHSSHDSTSGLPRVVYEIKAEADHLQPRLRLLVNTSSAESPAQLASEDGPIERASMSPGGSVETGASPEEGLLGPEPSSSAINLLAEASDPDEQVIEISYVQAYLSMMVSHSALALTRA